MTTQEILTQLEHFGNPNTKKIFLNHGAKEPLFGVKVQDLKKIQKKIKKDHKLSLELFSTGNSDAMYLAGLIADEAKMTKKELNVWVKKASWYMVSEYTVAWIASESKFGYELAREWIDSPKEHIASAGWATLSSLVSIKPDTELPMKELVTLLDRVSRSIHTAQNRVRHTMNGFVIASGCFVPSLTNKAIAVAESIGTVYVDMGGTACKVPMATDYIAKVKARGTIGKKKKEARC